MSGEAAWRAPLVPEASDAAEPTQLAYNGNLGALKRQIEENRLLPSAVDSEGRSLLHWACAKGQYQVVEYLLRFPDVTKQVNKADESGWTPVISAAAAGNVAILEALLSNGGDANFRAEDGTIALHHHKGRKNIIETLLPVTRDVNTKDSMGMTALHRAVASGHAEAAASLLAAGADANAVDKYKRTPLTLATEERSHDIVKLLLENGAVSER